MSGPVTGDFSARHARHARRSLLVGAALLLVLGACRPLYLPPIPDELPFEAGVRVAGYSTGVGPDGRPRVEVTLADLSEAGWLAVQWMAPSGRQAASASTWLEPAQPAGTAADAEAKADANAEANAEADAGALPSAAFALPADVELVPGEWRAVLSFGGKLLRQFTITLE